MRVLLTTVAVIACSVAPALAAPADATDIETVGIWMKTTSG
jgi:hypothetical protein